MVTLNELRQYIREEIYRLTEDPVMFGLKPPMTINVGAGKRHYADNKNSYSVEYFDKQQGTKNLGGWNVPAMAKQNALNFYKQEKQAGRLGTEISFIGVSSDKGNDFWIYYVDKSYLEGVNPNLFDSKLAYKNWLRVAQDVMRSGEPAGGQFNLKENDYTQPSRLDYPSAFYAQSGVTSPLDVVKAKSDFVDKNFVPDIRIKKQGPYYIFYGETYNVRDIFDLMKHHNLIPFHLKVIKDNEFWITKSKESAQKARAMINKRYSKKVV